MSGQSEHYILCRAGVEKTQQDALALLHPDWFSLAEHFAVDGRVLISHIRASGKWHVCRLLTHVFDHWNEGGFPMMDGEIDFLVIASGLLFAVDQQKAKLAAIGADGEIAIGTRMSVIPPRARGFRRERIALGLARGNHRGTLFHRPVVQGVDGESVPMDDVRVGTAVG